MPMVIVEPAGRAATAAALPDVLAAALPLAEGLAAALPLAEADPEAEAGALVEAEALADGLAEALAAAEADVDAAVEAAVEGLAEALAGGGALDAGAAPPPQALSSKAAVPKLPRKVRTLDLIGFSLPTHASLREVCVATL